MIQKQQILSFIFLTYYQHPELSIKFIRGTNPRNDESKDFSGFNWNHILKESRQKSKETVLEEINKTPTQHLIAQAIKSSFCVSLLKITEYYHYALCQMHRKGKRRVQTSKSQFKKHAVTIIRKSFNFTHYLSSSYHAFSRRKIGNKN